MRRGRPRTANLRKNGRPIMNAHKKLNRLALSLFALGMLSACGGGDSPPPPPPPPTPPAPAGSITLTGVVARGAALAGASVAVTCATGTGTATTNANGNYSLSIAGGALPCVLKATSSDSSLRLHSVAPAGAATSVTANVTPLTELVVARLTGADPAAYVAGVSASALAATATASAVAAAQASVASTLLAGGLNTASAGDFISSPLVAAVAGTAGNPHDQVLDALNAQLGTAGTTLAALTTTIAAGNTAPPAGGGTTGTSEAATLPADLLLKPKAANCASLASGRYRLVKVAPSPSGTVTSLGLLDLNASTLTFSETANPSATFTIAPNGNCRYRFASGAAGEFDLTVSPAGVMVARALIGGDDDTVAVSARGTTRMIVFLPVQTVAVADLAGTWNTLGWVRDGSTYRVDAPTVTVASSGAITSLKCSGASAFTPESGCATETALLPAFSANSAGGFNLISTNPADPFTDRAFAYRAGNGDLMGVFLSADGSIGFFTKVRTLALPAVGTVTAGWSVDLRVSGLAADPVYGRTNTVVSVNAAAGTLQNSARNDSTLVSTPQTIEYNVSRNGYTHRVAGPATLSDGSSIVVRELYTLPLRGIGLTVYHLPATTGTGASSNALYGVSAARQP